MNEELDSGVSDSGKTLRPVQDRISEVSWKVRWDLHIFTGLPSSPEEAMDPDQIQVGDDFVSFAKWFCVRTKSIHCFLPSQDSFPPINPRKDVGVSDQELVMMTTKDLNKLLKKRGIPKERAKEIKQERRTLKNRGYAANCRVKRETEEKVLERRNEQFKRRIEDMIAEADRVRNENARLQKLDNDLEIELKRMREDDKNFAMESQVKSYLKHLPDIKFEKVPDELWEHKYLRDKKHQSTLLTMKHFQKML